MHTRHFLGCAAMLAAVAAVAAVVTLSDRATTGVGVLAVALLCPVVMVGAMYLLSGRRAR